MPDLQDLISTTEYAQLHGKNPVTVRQLLKRGGFQSAVRLGRNWFIDKNEPYPDRRVTSGEYVGWREKYPKEE